MNLVAVIRDHYMYVLLTCVAVLGIAIINYRNTRRRDHAQTQHEDNVRSRLEAAHDNIAKPEKEKPPVEVFPHNDPIDYLTRELQNVNRSLDEIRDKVGLEPPQPQDFNDYLKNKVKEQLTNGGVDYTFHLRPATWEPGPNDGEKVEIDGQTFEVTIKTKAPSPTTALATTEEEKEPPTVTPEEAAELLRGIP
jgi:hypothetical protein